MERFSKAAVWVTEPDHGQRETANLHPTYCRDWKDTVDVLLTVGQETLPYTVRPLTKTVLKKMLGRAGLFNTKC